MNTRVSNLKRKLASKKADSSDESVQEQPKYVLLGKQQIKELAKVFKEQVVKEFKPIRDIIESIQKIVTKSNYSSQTYISQPKANVSAFQDAFNKYTPKQVSKNQRVVSRKEQSLTDEEQDQKNHVYFGQFQQDQQQDQSSNKIAKSANKARPSKQLNSLLNQSKVSSHITKSTGPNGIPQVKKMNKRYEQQYENDCANIKKLIEKRTEEDRNFTYEQKIEIMHLVDKARSYGTSLIDLCRKTGINKKWYRKWLEQLDKNGFEYS